MRGLLVIELVEDCGRAFRKDPHCLPSQKIWLYNSWQDLQANVNASKDECFSSADTICTDAVGLDDVQPTIMKEEGHTLLQNHLHCCLQSFIDGAGRIGCSAEGTFSTQLHMGMPLTAIVPQDIRASSQAITPGRQIVESSADKSFCSTSSRTLGRSIVASSATSPPTPTTSTLSSKNHKRTTAQDAGSVSLKRKQRSSQNCTFKESSKSSRTYRRQVAGRKSTTAAAATDNIARTLAR